MTEIIRTVITAFVTAFIAYQIGKNAGLNAFRDELEEMEKLIKKARLGLDDKQKQKDAK